MTHDEIIAVIQAHRDGKTVQCRLKGSATWNDVALPNALGWNFIEIDYRIKQVPREWWIHPFTLGHHGGATESRKCESCVHVREVIE